MATQMLNVSEGSVAFDYTTVHLDNPPRFYPYNFEVFDWKDWCQYVFLNRNFAFYAGLIYVFTIFAGKRWMDNREAFQLKRQLFAWNAALGIFSIVGFTRTAPEFFSIVLDDQGFYKSICVRSGGNMPLAFWSLIFILSKYVELGDTVFIVLRKRPLVFIQWYHHLMTLIMCWVTAPYIEPISRYYVVMNYAVHSLMYPYFALKALNVQIPRGISNLITTCQLSQMIIGLFINAYTAYLINTGVDCYRHSVSMKLSFLVYGSFTILFGKLFIDVVNKSKSMKKSKTN